MESKDDSVLYLLRVAESGIKCATCCNVINIVGKFIIIMNIEYTKAITEFTAQHLPVFTTFLYIFKTILRGFVQHCEGLGETQTNHLNRIASIYRS